MEKILKSSARVPANLYVKRGADAQIKKVIKEMLRPGYISVSRQMGKTNLLQNAKREIESAYDIIIYIDLSSSKYESSRQYFRFVIDTILEVHDDLLYDVRQTIIERRKDQSVSASGEHDRELRMILKFIPQRLVLVLDEVDTLAKADFSDEIFAQIRSIYFMRSTYNTLEKLTYILSGVIEPTKLIKNKDNSPFNIAEQIYLDDFSYDETLDFILKSTLPFTEGVKNEIYSWTNGNPRMTYEICSALEDLYLSGHIIDVADVQSVVKNIYLTDFNAAPVDHIRDIVASNSLVREAVKDVRRGASITDELKDQLYLYGITESKFKSSILKVKNKIIDLALSDEWLTDIETKTKGFYEFGLEKISNGHYDEGIKFILRYAEGPSINDVQRSAAFLSIADAYNRMGDYSISNEYIEKAKLDKKKRPSEYYYSVFKQGINYYSLNLYEKSFQCLEEIIRDAKKDLVYYNALLNKASFSLSISFSDNHASALEVFMTIISELHESHLPETYVNDISALCNFRIASIKSYLGLIDEAYDYYGRSLATAPVELKPLILIELIDVCPVDSKQNVASDLNIAIRDSGLMLKKLGLLNIEFTEKSLWQALAIIFRYDRESFGSIIAHSLDHYYQGHNFDYVILYNIANAELQKLGHNSIAEQIFRLVIECNELSDLYASKGYQGIALSLHVGNGDSVFLDYAEKALSHVLKIENYVNLSYFDLLVFVGASSGYREHGNLEAALKFIDFIVDRLDETDEAAIADEVIACYYLKGMLHGENREGDKALAAYKKAHSLVGNRKRGKHLLLSTEEELDLIVNQIGRLTKPKPIVAKPMAAKKNAPIISTKMYRNAMVEVKFLDGHKERGKYKKYEDAVKKGLCFII
jgi:tetratricopeptide (TPR) repeat protein